METNTERLQNYRYSGSEAAARDLLQWNQEPPHMVAQTIASFMGVGDVEGAAWWAGYFLRVRRGVFG